MNFQKFLIGGGHLYNNCQEEILGKCSYVAGFSPSRSCDDVSKGTADQDNFGRIFGQHPKLQISSLTLSHHSL